MPPNWFDKIHAGPACKSASCLGHANPHGVNALPAVLQVWTELADGSCRWRQTGSEIKVMVLRVPQQLPAKQLEVTIEPLFLRGEGGVPFAAEWVCCHRPHRTGWHCILTPTACAFANSDMGQHGWSP